MGQTIGQYEVVEHLGQGGMADVYKAFHPGLAIYRALKVIRMELGAGSDFKERFQREAQAVAGLRHPNIVRMQDFGIHDGLYYMVMEFIAGRDLKAELTQRGPIRPLTEVADIVVQVASALTYAHERNLVHRDVKPANMMRTSDGQIILTDFGIAKMLTTDEPITQTGVGIGTPAYMSPEQAQGLPTVGPPTDIYSLGVVLYQLLSGRVPYSADTPMAVALKVLNEPLPPLQAEVSDGIRTVVRKATAKDPENRYETADAMAEALAAAVDAEPESSPASETVTMALDAPEWPAEAPAEEASAGEAAAAGASDEAALATKSSGRRGALVAVVLLLLAVVGGGLYLFRGAWMPLVAPADGVPVAQAPAEESNASSDAVPADASPAATTENTAAENTAAEDTAIQDTATSPPALAARPESGPVESEQAAPPSQAAPEERTPSRRTATADEPAEEETTAEETPTRRAEPSEPASNAAVPSAPPSDDSEPASTASPSSSASADEARRPPGFYVEDAITIPGQTATFTYAGEAGETVYFDFVSASADADFVLHGPDGDQVLKAFMEDAGPVTLGQTGTYTLTVDPWERGTPSFAFSIAEGTAPAESTSTMIRPERPVQGTLATAGETATFTYAGEAGEAVYFDFVSASADADFVLRGPDGDQVLKAFMGTPAQSRWGRPARTRSPSTPGGAARHRSSLCCAARSAACRRIACRRKSDRLGGAFAHSIHDLLSRKTRPPWKTRLAPLALKTNR